MSRVLLSVDPSVRSTGLAIWSAAGVLTYCSRWTGTGQITPPARARRIASWLAQHPGLTWDLTIELPQVYAPGRGGGPARDLISVALVVGACAAACPGEITTFAPAEWIGGLPKATSGDPRESPRGARIWSRLTEAERVIAEAQLQHDVFDAIGIGLHHLGRFARRRGRKPDS